MGSYCYGKDVALKWIRENFPKEATVLDVGACDANWKRMLPEYGNMDAVEAYLPNCISCKPFYREAFCVDISEFEYDWYDLIIFGDVLEHLDVKTAQDVLKYAWNRCKDMLVSLPFLYPQGALYGNQYEIHKQPDLTEEIVKERYPQLAVLHDTGMNYCYYHKGERNE